MTDAGPTAAALAARRRQTATELDQVEKAIAQLRRERGGPTVRAIAERAAVSPTFLHESTDVRDLVRQAVADTRSRHDRDARETHERVEATWRERALNAEEALGNTQKEVLARRCRIGEPMGRSRDLDHMVPGDSVRRLATGNEME